MKQENKMEAKDTVTLIIAAKNEAKNIGPVLAKSKQYVDEVIVVDGHSEDETAQISRNFGARVFQDNKRGKGDALRVGASHASKKILVFIDADQSHDPEDIPKLLAPIKMGLADHVQGSRMLGGSEELFSNIGEYVRLFGSLFITLCINVRFKIRLTDSQNGLRAILKNCFLNLETHENITTIEQEMVIKTLNKGYRLLEVPTHEYRRKFGESNIKLSKVAFRYLFSLFWNLLSPKVNQEWNQKNRNSVQKRVLPSWSDK